MIKMERLEIGFDPARKYTEREYKPAPGCHIEEVVEEMKFRKYLEYMAERKAAGL